MNRFSFRNALLLLLVLSTLVAGPALADDKTDNVDKVFTAWDSTTSCGCGRRWSASARPRSSTSIT